MDTRKLWGVITGVRDWDHPPSQLFHSDHKVGQDCKEKQGADNDKPGDLVKVAWISPTNHADAVLVHDPAISDDSYADGGIEIRKVPSDIVLRGVEKGEGQCANQYSNIKIRDPRSLIGKPHPSFDLDRGCDFLWDSDLGRQRVDGMVIPDGGHVSFLVRLRIRDSIRSGILRPGSNALWERSKGSGRERMQDVVHRNPRATDESPIRVGSVVTVL